MSKYEELAALMATRAEDTKALCTELYQAAVDLGQIVARIVDAPSDPLILHRPDEEAVTADRVEIREPLSGKAKAYDEYQLLNPVLAMKCTRKGVLRFTLVLAFPGGDAENPKIKRIAMVVGAMYEAGSVVFALLDRDSLKIESESATASIMAQRIVEHFFTDFSRDIRQGRTSASIGFVLD
jgi:hypothetical protein